MKRQRVVALSLQDIPGGDVLTLIVTGQSERFCQIHEKIFIKHFEFVVKIFLEYLSEYRIWGLKIKK